MIQASYWTRPVRQLTPAENNNTDCTPKALPPSLNEMSQYNNGRRCIHLAPVGGAATSCHLCPQGSPSHTYHSQSRDRITSATSMQRFVCASIFYPNNQLRYGGGNLVISRVLFSRLLITVEWGLTRAICLFPLTLTRAFHLGSG